MERANGVGYPNISQVTLNFLHLEAKTTVLCCSNSLTTLRLSIFSIRTSVIYPGNRISISFETNKSVLTMRFGSISVAAPVFLMAQD